MAPARVSEKKVTRNLLQINYILALEVQKVSDVHRRITAEDHNSFQEVFSIKMIVVVFGAGKGAKKQII